jgi:WD40 repeat protein
MGPLHRDPGLYRAALSPSGSEVALTDTSGSGGSGHLTLVPLGGDELPRSLVLSHLVSQSGLGLAFSPDGTLIATVNASEVSVWSASDLSLVLQMSGGPKVAAIAATPRTPLLRETNDVGDAAFSPDGRLLVTSEGSNIQLIDVGTRSLLWSEPTGWYAGSQVGFTDDGRLLVNRSAGSIEQLNVTNGSPIGGAITPHIGVAINLAFDGARLVAGSNSSSTVAIYDLDFDGPITRALPLPPSTNLLEYDPAGSSLLLELNAASDPVVVSTRSVNDRTGQLGPILPSMVFPRFIEPHLVGGLLSSSLKIGEIDSNTARLAIPAYPVPFSHISNAQFNPNSRLLVSANIGGELDLYNEHGIGVATPWIKLGTYPVLSSSGFADNGSITVFDIGDQRVWVLNRKGRVVLQKSADVTMAALSPDASRLAILHDVHIDFYDAHSGAQIGGSIGVPPGSTDIEWSADSSRLLAFGRQEGQLIDALDGQPLGDPLPSDGYLALRPDGNEVASIVNGTLVLWDVDLAHLTSAACQAAGRNLTSSEWTQYLSNERALQRVCPQWP